MSDQTDNKQPTSFGTRVKLALVSLMTMLVFVVTASAADINTSIGPLLDQVVQLFVPLLALIVGALPIIITMAIIGFILGILAAILGKLKMS